MPALGGDMRPVGYMPGVDGLRTLAVVSVILFHLGLPWLPGGFVGVDVFFVISGFVVATSVLAARFDHFGAFLAFFYARRIVRIMPALILCVLVTALAAAMFIPPAWLSTTNDRTGLMALLGVSNMSLALNTDTYFSPRAEYNPYTHTWSLGVEEQFYFIFPIIFFFWAWRRSTEGRRRGVVLTFAFLSIASLVVAAILTHYRQQWAFYLIIARFWELGLGILLSTTLPIWRARMGRLSSASAQALGGLAVVLLAASLLLADGLAFPFPWALPPVLATALLIVVVVGRPETLLGRTMASAPMVYVGRRSYSLYLWHWPVFVLMRWTVGLETPLQLASALALTIVLALAAYRFVEDPVRHARPVREASRLRVVGVGLAGILSAVLITRGVMHYLAPEILLSVTRDEATWFPDEPLPVAGGCPVTRSEGAFAGGSIVTLSAQCAAPRRAGRLAVIGDSHATAYLPLLGAMAARYGYAIDIYTDGACPLFRLNRPNGQVSPACRAFVTAAIDRVVATAGKDGALFLPALRMPRYSDQWGGADEAIDGVSSDQVRADALAEALRLLQPVAKARVPIIIESPLPLFRAPPFRCSDWFNASNPVCAGGVTIARGEIEQRRKPALAQIDALEARLPGVTEWDPLPAVCPGSECSAFRDGKPLFFDGDHLSAYGNMVLLPRFEAKLAAVLSSPR
ncbi:acyltransferase family protein [Ancylobacter terrae]|uniref:acyltransferase family protein n=1 Tax=Ancylobacter sp. sgz301288 TaxID=3342077 RepID=UPI00385A4C13